MIKSNLPTIKISKDFLKYQNENSQTKKAVKEAKSFLEAIEQRNSTLIKVCVEIVKHQKDFFEKGAKFLKPLRLKDVAQDIGVHETTVSRISNAKYIQCEWGLFEVKYFFSNAVNVQSKDIISDKDSFWYIDMPSNWVFKWKNYSWDISNAYDKLQDKICVLTPEGTKKHLDVTNAKVILLLNGWFDLFEKI